MDAPRHSSTPPPGVARLTGRHGRRARCRTAGDPLEARSRLASLLAVAIVATALVFVSGGVPSAAAGYGALASGQAAVDAQRLPTPAAPVAVATGSNVAVTWTPVTMGDGTPVTGYVVERLDEVGTAVAILAGCGGVQVGTTCTEVGVPPGLWAYRVTALIGSWTGAPSATSASITVLATTLTITSPQPIGVLPATVTGTLGNFVPGETLTFRLDSPTGPVLAGSPTTVSSSSQPIGVDLPAGTSDAPHSIHVVGSLGSTAAASVAVVVPPVLQQLTMHDVDVDGRVDEVRAVFSESLASSPLGLSAWTLTNVPSGGVLAGVTVSGTTATLAITEGTGAASTAVGAFTVALAASPDGIRDVNGHAASFAAQAPLDRAAPAPATMLMQDANTNGRVDRVAITWSEPLAATTTTTAPWALAGVPSGGTLTAVTASGTTGRLTIAEGAGALDTAVGAFTVALVASPTGVRDAAGNQTAFAARAPTDGARPRPASLAHTDGATNGRIEPGDTLSVTFTEPIDLSSVGTSVTVTLTDPAGSGADRLTISGLTNGQRSIGGNAYVSTNNVSYAFANSPVSSTNGGRTVVVTVGPTCSGTCAAIGTQTTNSTLSFAAATTVRDLAGNLVTTATTSMSTRWF